MEQREATTPLTMENTCSTDHSSGLGMFASSAATIASRCVVLCTAAAACSAWAVWSWLSWLVARLAERPLITQAASTPTLPPTCEWRKRGEGPEKAAGFARPTGSVGMAAGEAGGRTHKDCAAPGHMSANQATHGVVHSALALAARNPGHQVAP